MSEKHPFWLFGVEGEISRDEWGPRGWYWLHTQAINYAADPSEQDRMGMRNRFWAFIQSLPCPECRLHATRYARLYPPNFSGGSAFQTWAWRFHNAVNHRLGKPLMDCEEYRKTYASELAGSYWNYVN